MKLNFSKYHGAGNDFILIDNRLNPFELTNSQIAFLCDRHFGIGADGLMLLSADRYYDFKMVYYNSDGNESSMCGNGGRCITAFASDLGIITQKAHFVAIDGEHTSEIIEDSGKEKTIKLKMSDVLNYDMFDDFYIINTGSPHFVKFVENVIDIDVYNLGKAIRNDQRFAPNGLNVNFVQIEDNQLFVRTYERGVENETLACGTGVTASALVFSNIKNVNKVDIKTLGGNLKVSFEKKTDKCFQNIYLQGPAKFVFATDIEL
jgi:diaminopimelate epimerase